MLFRSAWVAFEPDEIGTRSRTVNGVAVMRGSSSTGSGDGPGGCRLAGAAERVRGMQAEVVAQGGAGVVGAKHAALLQQRDDLVDERRQPAGGDVRDQDVAVGGVGLDELVDRGRDRL